jgi:DNA-binding CsgD family transcriptional regulator
VLRLTTSGMTQREIAARVDVDERTVRKILKRARRQ